ncbi:MAG: GNAT family N-acetyltransferase [Actinomycetes bacterium]
MTVDDAQAVAGWRYPGEYAFYNWDADPGDLAELLDPAGWGRQFFAVDGRDGARVGFFEFKADGESLEIGLGLRPDLTGGGLGLAFVEAGVQFAEEQFGTRSLTLAVAEFNQRAVTVYRRAGFEEVEHYEHETNGGTYPFVKMARTSPLHSGRF